MPDGKPNEGIAEIVALTEKILQEHPSHPGALHLYIHLMEPTPTPERAEKAADTLLTMMPDAGHMVHMSSHIFHRIGRYADAVKSNQLAVAADEKYIEDNQAEALYAIGYYPHNIHFLWFSATAGGQSRVAIESALKLAGKIDDDTLEKLPFTAIFRTVPYWAYARFGMWDKILKEPAPPDINAFLIGAWQYARGLAFVATGQIEKAQQSLAAVRTIMRNEQLNDNLFSKNTARNVLAIAPEVLAGEIAASQGKFDVAVSHLERAVQLEDALVYTEPAEWHFPPRQALGAILLEAGRAADAEAVYREDLRRNRENGWALYGLLQSLRMQQKKQEADLVEARFKKAWSHADIVLTSSRFGR